MRPPCSALLSGLLLAGFAGCAAKPDVKTGSASCAGAKLAELPMVEAPGPGGYWVVPAYFGEHPRGMILDTGATSNVMFSKVAVEERLHETGTFQYSGVMSGVTGAVPHGFVTVPLFKFAGIPLANAPMGVAAVDAPRLDLLPIAGLLGTPYMSVFDVEIDVPGQTVSLYERPRCDGVAPPWKGTYSTLPLTALSNNLRLRSQDVASSVNVTLPASTEANQARLIVGVQVNGHAQRALLDTGATTTLPPELAEQIGLSAPSQGVKRETIHGVDGGEAEGDVRRASELRVGDLVLRDKQVGVSPIRNIDADMLLGRDAFQGQRVWISFAQKRMFIQPSDSKP